MSKMSNYTSQQASNVDLQAVVANESTGGQAQQQAQLQPINENSMGLSQMEDVKCNEAFLAFDKDGSEDIDIDELRIVLRMMGI